MVASGLSLNMVFDDRTYAPTQLPGRGMFAMWATTWFTFGGPPYLLVTSDPITRGFEKVNAVGVEGAKRLFLGTGEAF
jgi:hypothetical protein